MRLKPPRPGSLGDSTLVPPPPSCSPFSGKSSWNTNTDSLAGGDGVFCGSTVTAGAAVGVQVVAGGTGVQPAASGAQPVPRHDCALPPANGQAAPHANTEQQETLTGYSPPRPGS